MQQSMSGGAPFMVKTDKTGRRVMSFNPLKLGARICLPFKPAFGGRNRHRFGG